MAKAKEPIEAPEQNHQPNRAANPVVSSEINPAADAAESDIPRLDQTTPGGAYLVNGVLVNAEGEPIE